MIKFREVLIWFCTMIFFISIAIPGSLFIDGKELNINNFNSETREIVLMSNNREINFNFRGSYSNIVREADTHEVVFEGPVSGIINYSVNSSLPEPLTLSWWEGQSYQEIKNLPPGFYYMETCWSIYPTFLPKKNSCVESNIFEVY